MAEPGLSFMDAKDQGDGFAVMDEATFLEQLRHRIDVLPPACRSGLDETSGGMDAQPLDVENGRRQKFGRERFRSPCVSPLVASAGRPFDGRRRVEDGLRRSLRSPPLGFAKPIAPHAWPCRDDRRRWLRGGDASCARARARPTHGLLFRITLGVANDLPVTLGEGCDSAFRDVEGDEGFLLGVKANPDPKRSQPVAEARLREGPILVDLVRAQRLGIDRTYARRP
jgi:hypothetical protein